MVFPIIYTIYIGFTNLGTGHMLDFTTAKGLLLNEKFIPADAQVYNLQVGETLDSYEVFLRGERTDRMFWGSVDKDLKVTSFTLQHFDSDVYEFADDKNIRLFSKAQIYDIYHNVLTKIEGTLPSGKVVMASGITQFAPMVSRYIPNPDEKGSLLEVQTGNIYKPDFARGYFTSGDERLTPGFNVSVGFHNFTKLFKDSKIAGPFFKVFIWTFAWGFFSVAFSFTVGMFLALLLNKDSMKFKFLYRMLLIIPYSIPFFISVLIFKGLLNKDFGAINDILMSWFDIKIPWLVHDTWAKVSCLLVNLWLGFPYMLLVLTGILQSIPGEVYEAAKIDGAGRWTTFTKITLPMIMSAVAPLLVGAFAFNFNNFVGIYLLTGGLPPMENAATPVGETDILISYTYRLAFEGGSGQDFGLASAISILIFFIISILTIINFRLSGVLKSSKAS